MNHLLPVLGLIRREMLVALRRKSSVFWLVVLVLCFLLMVAVSWPSSALLYLGQVGYVSRDILIFSYLILTVAAALVMPGLGAATIASERDMDTYDQVRLTLLGDFGLVLGKLINNLGLYVLFVVGAAPAIAASFFLTGVETFQLAAAVVCLVCTAVCCCLGGMVMGASFTRAITGNVLAYVVMLVYMGLPLLVLVLPAIAAGDTALLELVEWLMPVYPVVAMVLSIEVSTGVGWAGFMKTVLPVLSYSTLVSIALLFVTRHALRRRSEGRRSPRLAPSSAVTSDVGASSRQTAGADGGVDWISFPDFGNPVYHRESQCDARAGWSFATKVLVTGFVFTLGNALVAAFLREVGADQSTTIQVILSLDMGGAALFLPATVAGIFTADFERDRADMLRLTLLSPHAIGAAKVHKALEKGADLLLPLISRYSSS